MYPKVNYREDMLAGKYGVSSGISSFSVAVKSIVNVFN